MASGVQGQLPVEFPFYGLAGWDGLGWLEFFEGAVGGPVTTLWLAHRRPPERDWLLVGTAPGRTDADAAFAAAFALSEYLRPDPVAVPLPPAFSREQLDRVRTAAADHRSWPTVAAEVDGREVALRYWRYAGGWAGFVDGDRFDAAVELVGVGIGPGGLRLATVQDPASYHFDPSRPQHLRQLTEARAARPAAALPVRESTTLHPDQQEVLNRAER